MTLPYPYKVYKKVSDITYDELVSLNIKGVLLDIDGTLMRTKDKMPSSEVMSWIYDLKNKGIVIYILSNNKHSDRVKCFAEKIGVQWTHKAGKPRKAAFYSAAAELELELQELVVIGDQIFTDMLGAASCGIKGLIVDSLDTYLWYYHPRHLFEKIFWKEKYNG